MRKRNIHTKFRLNEKEAEYLNRLVKKSGLSREAYIRQLLNNLPTDDMPQPDYAALKEKLRLIGERFNQIARKAHMLNIIDSQRYDETIAMFEKVTAEIICAVMLLRKIEKERLINAN
jgi:hypothetical protein